MNKVRGLQDLLGPMAGEFSDLSSLFLLEATKHSDDQSEAKDLFSRLPQTLREAPAFFDRLGFRWRYAFGEPVTFSGIPGALVGPSIQFPQVEHLYLAIRLTARSLTSDQLDLYLARLSYPPKHQETLFEARPLFNLADDVGVEFEVSGYGSGDRTIDWRFYSTDHPAVLLEVKYRLGDVVAHFAPLASGASEDLWHPGRPEALFPGTFDKFMPRKMSEQIQGAWIHTNIKVEREPLKSYFSSLPPDRLHFALLSGWGDSAFLLSRDGLDRDAIVRLFGIFEDDNAVV